MIDPFITFVIFTDSLDDRDLLLTVNSIRQQTDMSWELEIRVFSVPDTRTISTFTHDNPRIIVTQRNDNERASEYRSTVISFLPKGIELFASATTKLRAAFEEQNVHVVAANTIFMTQLETNNSLDQACIFPYIAASRLTVLSDHPRLIEEISLPLGILRRDVFTAVPTDRPSNSSSLQDHEIKVDYLAQLESEILVLKTQLQKLLPEANFPDSRSQNLITSQQELKTVRAELAALRRSRTWKVGRIVLSPVWSFKKITRRFIPTK
jgi:hypothetical protein